MLIQSFNPVLTHSPWIILQFVVQWPIIKAFQIFTRFTWPFLLPQTNSGLRGAQSLNAFNPPFLFPTAHVLTFVGSVNLIGYALSCPKGILATSGWVGSFSNWNQSCHFPKTNYHPPQPSASLPLSYPQRNWLCLTNWSNQKLQKGKHHKIKSSLTQFSIKELYCIWSCMTSNTINVFRFD